MNRHAITSAGVDLRDMAIGENRKSNRVEFSRSLSTRMIAIDDTWGCNCLMEDVSDTGAKLTVGAR